MRQEFVHQINTALAFVAQTTECLFELPQTTNQQSAARLLLQLSVIIANAVECLLKRDLSRFPLASASTRNREEYSAIPHAAGISVLAASSWPFRIA